MTLKSYVLTLCFMAISLSSLNAAESNYAGLRLSSSTFAYDDINFINPRINFMTSGNEDQSGQSFSLLIGKVFTEQSLRVEIEYSNHSEQTFTSYWNPFTNFQKVTVSSQTLMANTLYDYKLKPVTIFGGLGLGVAQNKTSALQETASVFPEKTTTNLAYSLMIGISKEITKRFNAEIMYRYSNFGDAETEIGDFGLNDEQFKGTLVITDVSVALKYNF